MRPPPPAPAARPLALTLGGKLQLVRRRWMAALIMLRWNSLKGSTSQRQIFVGMFAQGDQIWEYLFVAPATLATAAAPATERLQHKVCYLPHNSTINLLPGQQLYRRWWIYNVKVTCSIVCALTYLMLHFSIRVYIVSVLPRLDIHKTRIKKTGNATSTVEV